jgi:beta-N-acetylhexosaminidase
MTLDEKIGQMLLLGWQGETREESHDVNSHAAALIDDLAAGGVILFWRNVSAPETLRPLTKAFQARAVERGLPPLFVAIDQEGGRINHLNPPDYTRIPTAAEIGKGGNVDQARAYGKLVGGELKDVGFNWNFAPVLDVNNNPANPVIGDRSYGDDPELVARMGVAFLRGLQEDAGVLACGKHFPGHGDTDTDSHKALPTIRQGRDRLDQIELVPFKAAIAAGLEGIMTAHILFSEIDPDLPATLSPKFLTGLLREELGFDGLIITDCLEMKGVADGWGTPEAGVLAVLAGADILLCCHTLSVQTALRDALCDAVLSGRISEERIDRSVARIQAAKARWVAGAAGGGS